MASRKLVVFGLVSLSLVGCAEHQEARNLARIMLGQETVYQEQLEAQIKKEEAFYVGSTQALGLNVKESAVTQPRVIVSEQSATAVAEAKRVSGPVVARDVSSFVERTLEAIEAQRSKSLAAVARYEDELAESLQKLEEQKAVLLKVRNGLEQLQQEPSTLNQAKQMFDFAKKVNGEAKKGKAGDAK